MIRPSDEVEFYLGLAPVLGLLSLVAIGIAVYVVMMRLKKGNDLRDIDFGVMCFSSIVVLGSIVIACVTFFSFDPDIQRKIVGEDLTVRTMGFLGVCLSACVIEVLVALPFVLKWCGDVSARKYNLAIVASVPLMTIPLCLCLIFPIASLMQFLYVPDPSMLNTVWWLLVGVIATAVLYRKALGISWAKSFVISICANAAWNCIIVAIGIAMAPLL